MSGLQKKITTKLLESEEDKKTVIYIESKYRNAGINGVPTCLINDVFIIQGAQTEEF